ncbi:hypothetical protein GBA52_010779 [Prunus armeniaca]|nr:hypothetical protein GBA52_010779 [Prunus armeniaca]
MDDVVRQSKVGVKGYATETVLPNVWPLWTSSSADKSRSCFIVSLAKVESYEDYSLVVGGGTKGYSYAWEVSVNGMPGSLLSVEKLLTRGYQRSLASYEYTLNAASTNPPQFHAIPSLVGEQVEDSLTWQVYEWKELVGLVDTSLDGDFDAEEASLDPRDSFKSFNIERIYVNLLRNSIILISFQEITTLSQLCQQLEETTLVQNYYLFDRLIQLVLTIPSSTATTE